VKGRTYKTISIFYLYVLARDMSKVDWEYVIITYS
jgi:hypothetical protein